MAPKQIVNISSPESSSTGPPSPEFIKSLSLFFHRDIIAIPLLKRYNHPVVGQKCGIKAATLELDTASYPNLDYIAGNRLSIYPMNPIDHVNFIVKFIENDLIPQQLSNGKAPVPKKPKLSDPWEFFTQLNGRDSIRLALIYLYDIMTAPSRELLQVLSGYSCDKDQKDRIMLIASSDENWERWICNGLRNLKSFFEEFNSCYVPAKVLFSELTLQQPRQYSISNIKSRKRFRTNIIVIQHRFTTKQIYTAIQNIKDREGNDKSNERLQHIHHHEQDPKSPKSPRYISNPTNVNVAQSEPTRSGRSSASIRSIRSVATFGTSPITTQQVARVPAYSGKLMSLYASSKSSLGNSQLGKSKMDLSDTTSATDNSPNISTNEQNSQFVNKKAKVGSNSKSASNSGQIHDGLCSNYLLNLNTTDHIICEFVENPRFTLKGNRERPIIMIGQGIGLLAFRAFWQQRSLEQDRAQMFYTLFKDLSPKRFGDLNLVQITGNKCKIEDLFRREVTNYCEHKVLNSVINMDKNLLYNLLDVAMRSSNSGGSYVQTSDSKTSLSQNNGISNKDEHLKRKSRNMVNGQPKVQTSSLLKSILAQRDIFELGNRLSRLLIDNNGCLYMSCDLAITQAVEILIVESVVRNHPIYSADEVIGMLNKWKGNTLKYGHQLVKGTDEKKYLFTIENPFERAQIVEEIYDEIQ